MNSVYDAPTREIYLLENVAIQGRKTELRQLLKLLNLAKTGQPKAALITGDSGIGKTALLNAFTSLVYEGMYCRVLDLGKMDLLTPEEVYVSIVEKLRDEANDILDEALVAVNSINQELDLSWSRQDLIRAISLVKLQESISGKETISQEQLVKAIRSQVPAVKKLKFSVGESIEKLVDLIVNPWVMIATSLLNPMTPALQEALHLADALLENDFKIPTEQKLINLLEEPQQWKAVQLEKISVPARETFPALPEDGLLEEAEEVLQTEKTKRKRLPMIVDPELEMLMQDALNAPAEKLSATPHYTPALTTSVSNIPNASASSAGESTSFRMDASPLKPIKDPLVKHLMNLLNFINTAIVNVDTAFLLLIDEWDRIQDIPQSSELKNFFSELLYHITEQKNFHFMVVMTARTEGESYTLGGSLYNHFRTKLLLDALNENACRKLGSSQETKDVALNLDEDVKHHIFKLSQGNPFWHLKIMSYLRERVESSRLRHVDMAFFNKLGIDHLRNLFELSLTRLKLTFLNDEQSLYKVIAALIKQFGEDRFSASRAIREISASQGFSDAYVFEVLRALFRHDFICQTDSPPEISAQAELYQSQRREPDLHYAIQSRFILDFLREKTRAIETDISTDEKSMYLKKIIPLAVKSGELDREKTMEVLALGEAMGNSDLVQFLEDIFLEHLQDEKAVVRVTVLNNIALINSARAREALFRAVQDSDSMVREYAARNLSRLSEKNNDPSLGNRIVDAMLPCIDDESEAVRAQVYATLSKYRWHRDLTSVFVKGMSDACDSVRITSIHNLADTNTASPYLFNCLMDAAQDKLPEVRRYACLGLQNYPGSESIDTIVRILQHDPDSGIRALAADSLSSMEDSKAFMALVNALRHEASEDAKLAVARALGKRRGWQTEAVLQEALQGADPENMPVFTWACVRSLGQMGASERSRQILQELKQKITNPIIVSATQVAIRRINERITELQQMERRLEEASPLAVSVPSENHKGNEEDEEIRVPEEEFFHHTEEADIFSDEGGAPLVTDVRHSKEVIQAQNDPGYEEKKYAGASFRRSSSMSIDHQADYSSRDDNDVPWIPQPKVKTNSERRPSLSERAKSMLKLPFEK